MTQEFNTKDYVKSTPDRKVMVAAAIRWKNYVDGVNQECEVMRRLRISEDIIERARKTMLGENGSDGLELR